MPHNRFEIMDFPNRQAVMSIGEYSNDEFNPLNNPADAWALERALKKRRWSFYYDGEIYFAEGFDCRNVVCSDESDTLLLLRCVSAQTSIPLFGEWVV